MSKLPASTRRTKRVLSLLVPTSRRSWGCASRVSLSFTTGAGILGLGQTVVWIATVDERLSPVFRLVDSIRDYLSLSRSDMHILLASCFRRLIWCYANSHASVTDVNEDGETLLGSALEKYLVVPWVGFLMNDNTGELLRMLSTISEPTSCARKITAESIPSLVANSTWFSFGTRYDQVAVDILSKYKESAGNYDNDWGLSWWSNQGYTSNGYRLLQAFPPVTENLDFGPLTRAVIRQDRNEVQQLLERCPSYINETNYCGQSPVHLAIETQNIAVISVVLQYSDAKALRATDNMGYYPIDYVTNTPWKTPWNFTTEESLSDCEGCKVLESLLRLDTPLFPTSLRNAAQAQRQLEAQGCPVATCLKVYEEDIGSADDHESIYSLISDGEVAEYAHQLGFYYSDNEFTDFICSLVSRMSRYTGDWPWTSHKFCSSYLSWMLDKGMSVSSRILAGISLSREIEVTAAHCFMAGLGLSGRSKRELVLDCPLSLATIEILLSETIIDRCRCWCSPGGCTPLAKLLEGMCRSKDLLYESQQDLFRGTERVIDSLLSTNRVQINDFQWIYAAIIRYYTFAELGLRHGCCSIIGKALVPLPEEEFQEIEEEDSLLLGLFKTLLVEFEDSLCRDINLEGFFEWMHINWVPRMRNVREQLASQRLTDEQLRDAESIGVVWEVYGPKPMEKKPDLSEWREAGLWAAMNQLDKIATDPERPTKESLQTHI